MSKMTFYCGLAFQELWVPGVLNKVALVTAVIL